jgi:regulator of chromosome condensation
MEIYETKKAKMPKFELSPGLSAKSIIKISCGGMHTVALCRDGIVFSWGNNDVGALGRSGDENTPFRVEGSLNIPKTDIVTGDSHSIAYSTISNQVFFWGCY